MARVRGLTLEQLEQLADALADLIVDVWREIAAALADFIRTRTLVTETDAGVVQREWQTRLREDILPSVEDAYTASAERVIEAAGLSVNVVGGNVVSAYLDEVFNRLTGVGDEVWLSVQAEIVEGVAQGEPIPEIADRVREVATVTPGHAMTIARTEVHAAHEAGAAAQATELALTGTKTWLATDDSRTRPTHRVADGQTVPVGDAFIVGGVPLRYPGDVFGTAAEVINCRCTALYDVDVSEVPMVSSVTARDTRGRFVAKESDVSTTDTGNATAADDAAWDGTLAFDANGEPVVPNTLIPMSAFQERDVDAPGGVGHALRDYWVRGPGAARIRWGTEGSMDRCVRFLREYVRDPGGLCAEYHRDATGEWPRGGTVPSSADTAEVALESHEPGECPPGQHRMPDGTCMPDEEMNMAADEETALWSGVLTVEGTPTGDGQMFAPMSLTWGELPLPMQWQKISSHGGNTDVTVQVGSIDRIWREPAPGNPEIMLIRGAGTLDLGSEDGREVHRRMSRGYMRGVSVVADMVEQADVVLEFPDIGDEGFPVDPEMTTYARGRIRAATLVDIPAYVEAKVSLVDEWETVEDMTASAVAVHDTPTTDGPWDGPEAVRRLPSPVPLGAARDVFAWIDLSEEEDGEVPKFAGKLPHHTVSEDGTPGAANLSACSAGIGALHGARGGVDIPESERRATYDHLAAHLRDGGMEPVPFESAEQITAALVAAATTITISDAPPREWFNEPTDVPATGALTVTAEGRIYGYVAPAGVRHRSYQDRAQYVPMKKVDYTRYMGGETITADGGRVATGTITMGCGHAPVGAGVGSRKAAEHYDNTCSMVASVRVGENRNGVWVAGALLPDVTADQVRRIMACRLSGDWRPHLDRPGWRELVAALLVPVPGFPMARSAPSVQLSNGEMVASSVPVVYSGGHLDTCAVNDERGRRKEEARLRVSSIVASRRNDKRDELVSRMTKGVSDGM